MQVKKFTIMNEDKQIDPRARKGSSDAMISCLGGDGGRTPPVVLHLSMDILVF